MKIVSVIGTSTADETVWNNAYQVGRLLAKNRCVVVCGGRGGVMEAVELWVTIPLSTCLGEARNTVVVSAGDVVISIGGAFGTLSEIGFALKMGRPVIALGTWQIQDEKGEPAPLIHAETPEEAVQVALSIFENERDEKE